LGNKGIVRDSGVQPGTEVSGGGASPTPTAAKLVTFFFTQWGKASLHLTPPHFASSQQNLLGPAALQNGENKGRERRHKQARALAVSSAWVDLAQSGARTILFFLSFPSDEDET